MKRDIEIIVDQRIGPLRLHIRRDRVRPAEQQQCLVDHVRPEVVEQSGAVGGHSLNSCPLR